MAKIDVLADFILSYEGGYGNDPVDSGGATKHGVTIATWKAQGYDKNGDGRIDVADLKLITKADAVGIMRKGFWNKWKADDINDQSVANILVDWVWGSGAYGIKIPQQMLGVKVDGIVGAKTIAAVNAADPKTLFDRIFKRRVEYIETICEASLRKYEKRIGRKATYKEKMSQTNYKFRKGWLRRLNAIGYGYLKLNTIPVTTIRF